MVQNSIKIATSGKIARDALRVADFAWDVTVSGTADGSIAVTDGCSLLLTPLSLNTVPPPMSMYKHQLSSPCIHSFFWPVPVPGGAGWGLACLSGENRVTLVFADEKGMPQRQANVDVASVICSIQAVEERSHELSTPWVARPFNMRGIAATQPISVVGDGGEGEGGIVYILLYGSRETIGSQQRSPVVRDEGTPNSYLAPDQIIILAVRALDGSVVSSSHISLLTVSDHLAEDPCRAAAVCRVSHWPGDPATLAVSLVADQNTFEVHRINVTHQAGDLLEGMELKSLNSTSKSFPQLADFMGTEYDTSKGAVQSPPEHCTQISVIPASTSAGSAADSTQYASYLQENNVVIGLTSKGKLYCGETLLVAGVSSFALNYPLEVLLYISTGTRPLLHFCSFTSLRYHMSNLKSLEQILHLIVATIFSIIFILLLFLTIFITCAQPLLWHLYSFSKISGPP
jgi:IKI3 family